MSIIAPTWSLARRFISLYSPETPLNRYLEYIRGFILRLGPSRRRPLYRSRYNPLSYVCTIYPISTCVSLTLKAKWRQARQKARAAERTDGRTDPLPLTPGFIVSLRGAINSRGFTVPWKSPKHPPANIIHGTRPLFLRVTFAVLRSRIAERENSTAEIAADRRDCVIR